MSGRFNPGVERLGLVGGRRSPWAWVEHVGRRTGKTYRTPVLPITSGDHLYVPLPYGPDVNWARLERRGRRYLRLHVLSVVPGRLDAVPAAATAPVVPADPAAAATPAGGG